VLDGLRAPEMLLRAVPIRRDGHHGLAGAVGEDDRVAFAHPPTWCVYRMCSRNNPFCCRLFIRRLTRKLGQHIHPSASHACAREEADGKAVLSSSSNVSAAKRSRPKRFLYPRMAKSFGFRLKSIFRLMLGLERHGSIIASRLSGRGPEGEISRCTRSASLDYPCLLHTDQSVPDSASGARPRRRAQGIYPVPPKRPEYMPCA
jgi:hypothetical protein